MGVVLGIVGMIIGIFGYCGALLVDTQSAFQQTVVELRHVHGALGLLLFGLGCVCTSLERRASRHNKPEETSPVATARPFPIAPRL